MSASASSYRTLWVVRAGSRASNGKHEAFNLREHVASVDWWFPDPMTHSLQELQRFQKTHDVRAEDAGSTAARQLFNFAHEIALRATRGERVYVVLPFLSRPLAGRVGIGRVTGPYHYAGARPANDEPWEQVGVVWLTDTLRRDDPGLLDKTRGRFNVPTATVSPIRCRIVIENLLGVIQQLEQ